MHSHTLKDWSHDHVFLGPRHDRNERRTWWVVGITATMMVVEIVGGTMFGSMALLADGWHMSTHAAALGIAALTYRYARRHARDPRFAFGTGKLGDLGGFTSAVVLAMVALGIGYESVVRFAHPVAIQYDEALAIAAIGLVINLLCAWLLGETSGHHHDEEDHEHHHAHDHNLRSAYWHVLADAMTSVLAIAGLLAAQSFGWAWLDPVVGIVGALVILQWSRGLIGGAAAVLLDAAPDPRLGDAVRERLEVGHDRIADLHVWRLGPGHYAAIVALVSDAPQPVEHYKDRLSDIHGLSHLTIEVNRCNAAH
jgi:cation diffusion facilitator family transporter